MTAKDMRRASAEEILTAAAQVLREKGWYQGNYYVSPIHGPFCALGAIRVVVTGTATHPGIDPLGWSAIDRAHRLLAKRIGSDAEQAIERGFGVPTVIGIYWNDQPTTTFEEVLRVLEGTEA